MFSFFLRKSRVFNKSRYSRSKQISRVAFYLALYIDVAVVFSVFFLFYGVSMEHSLLWWFLYCGYVTLILGFFIRHWNC